MSIQHNTQLLREAAKAGNAEDVQRLIPLSDPKDCDSLALRTAATLGHTECVELLIPVSNVFSDSLRWAAHNGHVRCVELLILETPPQNGSKALQWAAEHGHTECVKLLIPISNPKEDNSLALQLAVQNGHTECIELLYSVSDPTAALNTLKHKCHPKAWIAFEQYIEAEEAKRLRAVLVNEVGEGMAVRQHPKHKM